MSTDRHYKTRCTVPMINRLTRETDFEIVLYGIQVRDLCTVPNEIAASLARRYPEHIGSIFLVREGV